MLKILRQNMLKTTGQNTAEDIRSKHCQRQQGRVLPKTTGQNTAEDKTTGQMLLKALGQNTAKENRANISKDIRAKHC